MRRYSLQHVTRYAYDKPVTTSYGRAHLKPGEYPGQDVSSTSVVIRPKASELTDHVDYFGNVSTYFCVRTPHKTLVVTARSELEVTREVPSLHAARGVTWEQLRGTVGADPALAEYTLPSPRVAPSAAVSAYADDVFAADRPAVEVVDDVLHRIYGDFTYKSGSTTTRTTSDELLETRKGVCQDFAHLAVGALRSRGLAARYVSGYIETIPRPGQPKLQGVDASHAWASVWLPALGWVDFDPTNDQYVDDRYLVTAVGRDYGDVPPLKGVILTEARKSTLKVGVDVTRLD